MNRTLRTKSRRRSTFLVFLPELLIEPPASMDVVADWLLDLPQVCGVSGQRSTLSLRVDAHKPMPADWKQQLSEAFPSVRVVSRSNQ